MDYYLKETEGKTLNDASRFRTNNRVWVSEPVIIGAGPSGLAVAACLKQRGVSSIVIERDSCIAPLWQNKTYDRLRLHLPKQFCELLFMLFPDEFPTYPNRKQFVAYLDNYVDRFDIRPIFNRNVLCAEFDETLRAWRIKTCCAKSGQETKFVTKWVIVVMGENADEFVPKIEGMSEFKGTVLHSSAYKNGDMFDGKKVLVVGCGNSGMEVCLDLSNYNARAALVVDSVCTGIKRLRQDTVEFWDGKVEKFDVIIFATGYKSNVPTWLKEGHLFSDEGFPLMPFPNGRKGKSGLYAVGFSRRGLLGAAADARRIADDVEDQWKVETKSSMAFH